MEKKKIKCPKCGHVLILTYQAKSETVKHFNCPKCSAPLVFKISASVKNEPSSAPKKEDESETIIVGPSKQGGVFYLSLNGHKIKLADGQNSVGRKSPTSSATVQLDCGDQFMSRSHVLITVVKDSLGNKYVTIQNHKNLNHTWVNGVQINQDDILKLSNGDRITMGKTTVVFREE